MMRKKTEKLECPSFNSPEELQALSPEDQEKVEKFFSREIPLSETRALTLAEREQFDRAIGRKRKPGAGRPKIGQGAKVVSVTLERGFLKRVDAYARKHKLKRAELIVRGLAKIIDETDKRKSA
jgi:hypothetical protein